MPNRPLSASRSAAKSGQWRAGAISRRGGSSASSFTGPLRPREEAPAAAPARRGHAGGCRALRALALLIPGAIAAAIVAGGSATRSIVAAAVDRHRLFRSPESAQEMDDALLRLARGERVREAVRGDGGKSRSRRLTAASRHIVEEEGDRHLERLGEAEQGAGGDAVGAALVFLDLLKADASDLAEPLLAQAEHQPAQLHPRADMRIDRAKAGMLGQALKVTRHELLHRR